MKVRLLGIDKNRWNIERSSMNYNLLEFKISINGILSSILKDYM